MTKRLRSFHDDPRNRERGDPSKGVATRSRPRKSWRIDYVTQGILNNRPDARENVNYFSRICMLEGRIMEEKRKDSRWGLIILKIVFPFEYVRGHGIPLCILNRGGPRGGRMWRKIDNRFRLDSTFSRGKRLPAARNNSPEILRRIDPSLFLFFPRVCDVSFFTNETGNCSNYVVSTPVEITRHASFELRQ